MQSYNPQKIEQKWAKIWDRKKAWRVDLPKAKKPYYNLMMFPYPSAEGLHVGNVYAFTGSDIHGRFQRMQGFDVFEPMGFDSFGIHSENFAIKKGVHPKVQTAKNIKHFTEQLKQLGSLFAWDHAVTTSEPEYYKWTQWLFLQLYKGGLAYRAKAPVDWCPSCKTVLADEQVINGKCERCSFDVLQKETEQWFFRITKYADRLLKNLETIDWSGRTKIAQKNWIGKSEGAVLKFEIRSTKSETNTKYKIQNTKYFVEVFTTRPDTLFGATYMVLAPEHELVSNLNPQIFNRKEVEAYIQNSRKKTEFERTELAKEKTGVQLEGIKAINPANKEEIPVFVADYVLASYGTGAIMAVPAHDERDFEFARKYNLKISCVIEPLATPALGDDLRAAGLASEERHKRILGGQEVYTQEGTLVSSGRFDGMDSEKAKWEITERVGGKRTVKYHLRDWLISRQRYWGPPIPIIYCEKCGTVPVPEKDLPVKLPFVKEYRPEGTGKSPLASISSFVKTKCPQCKGKAERETDVSDTFLDSAWYYLRYPSVKTQNPKPKTQKYSSKSKSIELPWDSDITKKWLPVDMYIGGQEHAVLHLLYTRFITMALKDMGYVGFEEPFKKFRAHGLITKDGTKMSKSRGNVVNPDEYFKKYGADTVRMYLMFLGPFSEGGDWSDKGIVGIYRFLNRVWNFVQKAKSQKPKAQNINSTTRAQPLQKLEGLGNKTIKKVTADLENLRYNTAIASLMEYFNSVQHSNIQTFRQVETLLILLAPFAPCITEELWGQLGNRDSIHRQAWPIYDENLIKEEKIKLIFQVNGKVRDIVEVSPDVSESEARDLALKSPKIKKWLQGKEPKKIIFVPGRLVNVVC